MCEGSACMYVHVPHICLVPVEIRRVHWIPWDWTYRCLTPEPSLQQPSLLMCVCVHAHAHTRECILHMYQYPRIPEQCPRFPAAGIAGSMSLLIWVLGT